MNTFQFFPITDSEVSMGKYYYTEKQSDLGLFCLHCDASPGSGACTYRANI